MQYTCVCMYLCMYVCMYGWMDGLMDGCVCVCMCVFLKKILLFLCRSFKLQLLQTLRKQFNISAYQIFSVVLYFEMHAVQRLLEALEVLV